MAHYTIEDLRRLAEQGSGNIPEYASSGDMPEPVFRVDVRRQIYDVLCQSSRALTIGEIAKALGKKNSTWFRGRVEVMYSDGLLRR